MRAFLRFSVAVPILLCGCTHRSSLTRGSGLDEPLVVHARADREMTVVLVDGSRLAASRVAATGDSLVWLSPERSRLSIPLVQVREVRSVDRGRGLGEGLMAGVAVGGGAGIVIGAAGSGSCRSDWCPGPAAVGAALGAVGGILGLIIGSGTGHTDIFVPPATASESAGTLRSTSPGSGTTTTPAAPPPGAPLPPRGCRR